MKPAIENVVQIYEQEHVVKIFWRTEFLEEEKSKVKRKDKGHHFGEI